MAQSLNLSVAVPHGRIRLHDAVAPRAAVPATTPANGLLQAMGAEAAASLIFAGRRISLAPGEVLWRAGETPALVCFPLHGVVSAFSVDEDGVAAAVDCTGAEGAVGLIEGMADLPHGFESRAILATEAWLVPVEALGRVLGAHPRAADVARRQVARLYDRARRAAACGVRHSMRARLADCLLAYDEKAGLARLPVTQEGLSAVLGANRTTVTALMVALASEGLTRQGRGWVSILDRERLTRLACGCSHDASGPAPRP